MEESKPVIFLMGPTASGKTDLAMHLYDKYPVELISVDSAQVYRYMDIGSAKPEKEVLDKYPHHLIDVADPAENYSAGRFRDDALELIEQIHNKDKVPLFVGGTMMYFQRLFKGLAELPSQDAEIRAKIEARAKELGWPAMHKELASFDPQTAERIHFNDQQRIQRAIEVYKITGRTLSAIIEEQSKGAFKFPLLSIGLNIEPRSLLHQRIELRYDMMLEQGFEEEVKKLKSRQDLHSELPSIRAVGYRQMWQYLSGEIDYETMRSSGIIGTRQLAKRQLTWMRQWPELNWLDALAPNLAEQACSLLGSKLNLPGC